MMRSRVRSCIFKIPISLFLLLGPHSGIFFGSDLTDAIRSHKKKEAIQLIQKGANLETADQEGNTPLILASLRGDADLVEILLRSGAKTSAMNRAGLNALQICAKNPHNMNYLWFRQSAIEITKLLLAAGSAVNATTVHRTETALMLSAQSGLEDVTAELIRAGAGMELRDVDGKTALHHAVLSGKTHVLRTLIQAGANVNARETSSGKNALTLAVPVEHSIENAGITLRLLIQAGARLDDMDKSGWSALMYAARYGRDDLERILIKAGARANKLEAMKLFCAINDLNFQKVFEQVKRGDANVKEKEGLTPLMLAAKRGSPEIVQLLLSSGAKVNVKDSSGQTPLMLACDFQDGRPNHEVVELLLRAGANVNALDESENSALGRAVPHFLTPESSKIVSALLKAEADPNTTHNSLPVMFQVIQIGDVQSLQALINAGANINSIYQGTSPLKAAVKRKQSEIVKLLLDHGAADPSIIDEAQTLVQEFNVQEERLVSSLPVELGSFSIALTRTPCEGFCPAFFVTVNEKGEVYYNGYSNVDIAGAHRYNISPESLKTILLEANKANFFEVGLEPPSTNIYDREYGISTTSVTVTWNEKDRTISNQAGIDLRELVEKIEDVTKVRQWVETTPAFIKAHKNETGFDARANLMHAIDSRKFDLVKAFIDVGCDVQSLDQFGNSPLAAAVSSQDFRIVELLIKAGARADTNSLIAAISYNDLESARYLLKRDASIISSKGRMSPLHAAANHGSTELMELLISAGAELNAKDSQGNTPLLLASGHRNLYGVEALIKAGANVELANNEGLTPLLAVLGEPNHRLEWHSGNRDNVAILQALIESGANVNSTSLGKTPLILAVTKRDYLAVDILLRSGADKNITDSYGNTPMRIAQREQFTDIIALLESRH